MTENRGSLWIVLAMVVVAGIFTVISCKHVPEPMDLRVEPIVCGNVPDGDFCCVSVHMGRLIQRCRADQRQDDQMRRRLDMEHTSAPQ